MKHVLRKRCHKTYSSQFVGAWHAHPICGNTGYVEEPNFGHRLQHIHYAARHIEK